MEIYDMMLKRNFPIAFQVQVAHFSDIQEQLTSKMTFLW